MEELFTEGEATSAERDQIESIIRATSNNPCDVPPLLGMVRYTASHIGAVE